MKQFVVLVALAVLVPSAASAVSLADELACKADAEKLCPGMTPGEGKILECLAPQKEKLSDACRAVVEKHGG